MPPDVVRLSTDAQVLDALLRRGRLTRAGVAEEAGVSKPTASQSVLRLLERGLVRESGRQSGGRGRNGTYCEIAPHAGLALALHAGPGEIVAECVDAAGELRHRETRPVGTTMPAGELLETLVSVVAAVEAAVGVPLPARAVSVADPVDRERRRLVHLSGSPFVIGGADLSSVVGPGGVLDNDVAWAALAELGVGERLDSFVYVHLGVGLGAGIVDAGRLVGGARGLAGEFAYVLTVDADGRSVRLLDALGGLDLMVPGTTSLDVSRVRVALAGSSRGAVVGALAGACASLVALLEPAAVVLGGPWGGELGLAEDLADALADAAHAVEVQRTRVEDGPLVGVRLRAVELAREALLAAR